MSFSLTQPDFMSFSLIQLDLMCSSLIHRDFMFFFLILQVVPAVVAIVLIIGTFPFISISIERLEKYSKTERHFRQYNSLTYITKKTLEDRIRKKVQLLKVVVRK